jgi:hypothetical protein
MIEHAAAGLLPTLAVVGIAVAMVLSGLEKKQLEWKRPGSPASQTRLRGPFEWLRRRS